jgi:hypothetical protein
MDKPLVDVTTLNAVQSLFMKGQRDPWAEKMAGAFADLYIYGDTVRYALAVPGSMSRESLEEPRLLLDLQKRDSEALIAVPYSTAEPRILKDEYLLDCFEKFGAWVVNNKQTLQTWSRLHNEPWIRGIPGRIQHGYVFSLEKLQDYPKVAAIADQAGLDHKDLFYAFDIILRYPLYGELAGADQWYLNHPIRNAITLPTMATKAGPSPGITVSFKESVCALAPKLSFDEYAVLLYELRGAVRDRGLNKLQPGNFDRETIREIAAQVKLPPRISNIGKLAGIAGGVFGGLGAITVLSPLAAVAGAIVAIGASLWQGELPRAVANVQWLHWAFEWDVERQAEERH